MTADGKWCVGITGSYGGLNLGDEAILEVIVRDLRRAVPVEVTVFSRNPRDTVRRHQVEHAVLLHGPTRRELGTLVGALDLLILGGGGILYDLGAQDFLREVFVAHEVGTPVMVYAVGVGPLSHWSARGQVREALERAAVITVRDIRSRKLLEEIGVQRDITVTADPALLLEPQPLSEEVHHRLQTFASAKHRVAFSVREPGPAAPQYRAEHALGIVADVGDFAVDRLDAELLFVRLERQNVDIQTSHSVCGHMRRAAQATVLQGEYTPGQLVSVLEHFDFSVGMRLHFLIFSALAGIPFLALTYASKVDAFVEELHLDAPQLERVSAGELIAHFDRTWDDREAVKAIVQSGLGELRERARANNEIALRLLAAARASSQLEAPRP